MGLQTNQTKAARAARQAGLQRSLNERTRNSSDGDVHAIDRQTRPRRTTDASTLTEVEKPAKRRWKRASHIPQMPDIPGYALKYVRIDGRERGDQRTVFRHIQEGWEFARKSDFPKRVLPTQSLGQHGEVIGNGDMVLMKIEESMREERNQTFAEKRDRATYGVEAELDSHSDPRMPIRQSRKSSVQFKKMRDSSRTRGRVAADDDL